MANGNVSSEDIYTLNGKKDGAAITPIEFDSSTAAYLYASINELTEISVVSGPELVELNNGGGLDLGLVLVVGRHGVAAHVRQHQRADRDLGHQDHQQGD